MKKRLKTLAIAPYCDGTDVGEAWCAFQWIKHLSEVADVTLLAMSRPGRKPLEDQLPNTIVITKPEPEWALRHERLNAMAKLSYPGFYRWAKTRIQSLQEKELDFDVAHQFAPIALRFPSPLACFNIPYVLGPHGGSLPTPWAFRSECKSGRWFTNLRGLDRLRLKFDPWLRHSFNRAALILGVAPYVGNLLSKCNRFIVESELGIDSLPKNRPYAGRHNAPIRLLHVGRGVRTKGLRDLIRALGKLDTKIAYRLDVAGKGEEIAICQSLARDLGVSKYITFHGQVSRQEVDTLYSQANIFCFPSFREPSGSVIFEAMSHGLPLICANAGGPAHVVDDDCGIKVDVTTPERFSQDLADAIYLLSTQPLLRRRMSKAACAKMHTIALWQNKIERLLAHYHQILQEQAICRKEPRHVFPFPNNQGSRRCVGRRPLDTNAQAATRIHQL